MLIVDLTIRMEAIGLTLNDAVLSYVTFPRKPATYLSYHLLHVIIDSDVPQYCSELLCSQILNCIHPGSLHISLGIDAYIEGFHVSMNLHVVIYLVYHCVKIQL